MLLKIKQAAVKLNVTESWLRYMVFNKKICFVKLGNQIRFDEDELDRWIKDQSNIKIIKREKYNE